MQKWNKSFQDYGYEFEDHYKQTYVDDQRPYDYYRPGYRYGYVTGQQERFRGRTWDEARDAVRSDWESSAEEDQPLWEDVEEAVRHAWQRVREALDAGEG